MIWMPRPTPPKYRTTNWPEYNAALKRRRLLEVWFEPEMDWFAMPMLNRQATEIKVRAAVLNHFSQIGMPNTIRIA